MQDPQRPRRASTQALGVVITPERRNSFEEAQPEAQVSSKRREHLSYYVVRNFARARHARTGVLRAPPTHTGDDEKERQGGELQRAS